MEARRDMSLPREGGGLLEGIYRQYRAMLVGYVQRTFGLGPPDPEDVTHAAFARFAQLDHPEDVRNPAAFLRATARHIVIDSYRRDGRTAAVLDDIRVLEQNGHDVDAEIVLSSKQELARVDLALRQLKPQQRVAFLMHRVDELSYAEIGARLGISESGARKLVARALNQCVRALRRQELLP